MKRLSRTWDAVRRSRRPLDKLFEERDNWEICACGPKSRPMSRIFLGWMRFLCVRRPINKSANQWRILSTRRTMTGLGPSLLVAQFFDTFTYKVTID